MKQFLKYFGLTVLIVVLLGVGFIAAWGLTAPQPEPTALNSLASTDTVTFDQVNNWLVYTPSGVTPDRGLILYPGGRVDARSYAPQAQAIAAEGFLVIVVPMPLNFAILGINRAEDVINAYPEIDLWAVGGHSLGGAMAAQFANANRNMFHGLVLWAAYPAGSTDLSDSNLAVVSIFASNDGVATREDIDASILLLPAATQFVEIEGGNHAGFGWYGPQNGDGVSTISQMAQQEQTVDATVALLKILSK